MIIEYRLFKKSKLQDGATLIIKERLYSPGVQGIRSRVLDCENQLSAIIIAYHNEKPIGCVTLDLHPIFEGRKFFSIVNTWIKPSYRRKGIASVLLKRISKHSQYTIAGYASKAGSYFYKDRNIECIKY